MYKIIGKINSIVFIHFIEQNYINFNVHNEICNKNYNNVANILF